MNFSDNEFHTKSNRMLGSSESSTMVRLLISMGLAKNQKQANVVLVGILVLIIAAIFYIYSSVLKTPQDDYVVGPDGTKYSAEEYIEMLGRGENPF